MILIMSPAPASSGRDVSWDDIDPNTLASPADVGDPDSARVAEIVRDELSTTPVRV